MRDLKKKKNVIAPDLTPLIDVVFLLLIFFMLVTTFNQYANFQMALPKSDVQEIVKNTGDIELILDKDGKYFLKIGNENIEISNENLENEIKNMMNGRNNQTLIISADKELKYEVVIKTMGRLKNTGIEKLEINTIK